MDFDTPDNLENTRSEWEDDISFKDALKEVNAAKARLDMKRKAEEFGKALDYRRQEDRWKAMYDFLMKYNPYVANDIRLFNADCEKRKQEQNNFKAQSKHMRYALSMPQMLWDVLALIDDEIKDFNSLDKEHQRKILYKLGRTFPVYWIPRV